MIKIGETYEYGSTNHPLIIQPSSSTNIYSNYPVIFSEILRQWVDDPMKKSYDKKSVFPSTEIIPTTLLPSGSLT